MQGLEVNLNVHTIKRHDKTEGWDLEKPYLWLIFFKADGVGVKLTKEFKLGGNALFRFSKGSHGNLGDYPLETGDIIKIPEEVGNWRTTLEPIEIPYFEDLAPGTMGAIGILMKENNVSAQGAEAGHQALNNYIKKVFGELLSEFEPKVISISDVEGSLERYFISKIDQYAGDIEKVVAAAVRNSQSLIANIWSLVKKDDLIGFEVWKFNHDDIKKNDNNILFSKRWTTPLLGDWEIFGDLKAEVK